ncbi:hypothetical protein B0H10DRAFT_1946238 [Mycena sp. CBHHK59/15]|nr:hypothetical protein B0H10DRAFT_1946238 [Mycena sp. CBHHK59/15]
MPNQNGYYPDDDDDDVHVPETVYKPFGPFLVKNVALADDKVGTRQSWAPTASSPSVHEAAGHARRHAAGETAYEDRDGDQEGTGGDDDMRGPETTHQPFAPFFVKDVALADDKVRTRQSWVPSEPHGNYSPLASESRRGAAGYTLPIDVTPMMSKSDHIAVGYARRDAAGATAYEDRAGNQEDTTTRPIVSPRHLRHFITSLSVEEVPGISRTSSLPLYTAKARNSSCTDDNHMTVAIHVESARFVNIQKASVDTKEYGSESNTSSTVLLNFSGLFFYVQKVF